MKPYILFAFFCACISMSLARAMEHNELKDLEGRPSKKALKQYGCSKYESIPSPKLSIMNRNHPYVRSITPNNHVSADIYFQSMQRAVGKDEQYE